jgi:hypothetical protein
VIENNPVSFFVAIGVLVLALVLIFVVLYAISSGALAESVAAWHQGETPRFSTPSAVRASSTSGVCWGGICHSF